MLRAINRKPAATKSYTAAWNLFWERISTGKCARPRATWNLSGQTVRKWRPRCKKAISAFRKAVHRFRLDSVNALYAMHAAGWGRQDERTECPTRDNHRISFGEKRVRRVEFP